MKKFLTTLIIIYVLLTIIYIIYYNFLGGNKNNLGSNRFYIDELSNNTFITSKTKKPFMMLAGVINKDYDDNYIIIVRKDMEHFECKEGIPILSKKQLQYMLINKKTNKVLVTNDMLKFERLKKELNINLKFNKTPDELKKIVQNIKSTNLHNYSECTQINTYPLIEIK